MSKIFIILTTMMATTALGQMAGARADHHHQRSSDHKVARAALARGEVLPLEKILMLVRPKLKDEIVGIKFEIHGDVWFYEFRVVDQAGHLHYVHANAITGIFETVGNHQ